jgi:hypothetical protein
VDIRCKLALGLQQIMSPETRIDVSGYNWRTGQQSVNYTSTIYQPAMISNTLVVNGGVDIGVKIWKSMNVLFGLNILNSYAHFTSNNPHVVLLSLNAGLSYGIK